MSSHKGADVTDLLAEAAVAPILSGMIVGLGTGRTASRAVLALADRVANEGLKVKCVSTSHETDHTARALQLDLLDFTMVERVDYLFDGADEVDPRLRMIKGRGGAMLRERIVAAASERRVYIVGDEKQVDHLGQRCSLPVAIHALGMESIRAHLRRAGLNGVLRRTMNGDLYLTDQGNLIIDVAVRDLDVAGLAQTLDSCPGVVDHGLFLTECDELLIETEDGIKKIVRDEIR